MADKTELLEENYLLRKEVDRLKQVVLELTGSTSTDRLRPTLSRFSASTSLTKPPKRMRTSKENAGQNSKCPSSRMQLLIRHQKDIKQAKHVIESKITEISTRLSGLKDFSKPLQQSNFAETSTPLSLKELATERSNELSSSRTFKQSLDGTCEIRPQQTLKTSVSNKAHRRKSLKTTPKAACCAKDQDVFAKAYSVTTRSRSAKRLQIPLTTSAKHVCPSCSTMWGSEKPAGDQLKHGC